MKLASLNLTAIDFNKIQGVKTVYPIPMPVFAEKVDSNYQIYPLVNKVQWSRQASMEINVNLDKQSSVPLVINKELFEANFIPLGEIKGNSFDSGVYGKTPRPVQALSVGVPCSYHSDSAKHLVEPNSVVIKTSFGTINHYDNETFDRKFVNDLSMLKGMRVTVTQPELKQDYDNDFGM